MSPLTPQTVYNKILPVYFPRTKEEQDWALPVIPADIGRPHLLLMAPTLIFDLYRQ